MVAGKQVVFYLLYFNKYLNENLFFLFCKKSFSQSSLVKF